MPKKPKPKPSTGKKPKPMPHGIADGLDKGTITNRGQKCTMGAG